MVALKYTSIKAAILIRIFIVLTIIDRGSSEESEEEKCTRYIKQLYNETDPLEMFKKGFLYLNDTVIKDYNKSLDPDPETEKSMNNYTTDYFYRAVIAVRITGKDSLPTAKEYCESKYPERNETIKTCTDTINQKFHIPRLTENDEPYDPRHAFVGKHIFNYFYYIWSKTYVTLLVLFYAEHTELSNRLANTELSTVMRRNLHSQFRYFKTLFGYIESYYQLFENILGNADVSRIPTPEAYCEKQIREGTGFMENINFRFD